MVTDESKRSEILISLFETAWTNFDRRRSYEWKFSLAIWTALTAFIALTLRGVATLPSDLGLMFLICAVMILVVQFFFLWRVRLANDPDKERALLYEDVLNYTVGVSFKKTRVEEAIAKVQKCLPGWWTILVHMSITAVLIFAARATVYRQSDGGSSERASMQNEPYAESVNAIKWGKPLSAEDWSEMARNYATCLAFLGAGFWAYKTFVRNREKYPRANISHRITHRRIDDDKVLLRVAVVVRNEGDVMISLNRRLVRIQQMVPWPKDKDVLERICLDSSHTEHREAEVEWPVIAVCELDGNNVTHEIEPREKDEYHFDFVIDGAVKTVIVYSYFRNQRKRRREIGWNKTSIYDLEKPKEIK